RASTCPVMPPPSTRAVTSYLPTVSVSLKGCRSLNCWVVTGKYSFPSRPFTVMLPFPSVRTTRATEVLRRPRLFTRSMPLLDAVQVDRAGLLGLVLVLAARCHVQVVEQAAAQAVLGQHAAH